eukprot:GHVU01112362.1.p1 GENE.GHVU01112362.1~~GHVU01112362.1.p1  ORF type:complete len:104 (-),score=2.24 GHVU01112362.1:38-349(-)
MYTGSSYKYITASSSISSTITIIVSVVANWSLLYRPYPHFPLSACPPLECVRVYICINMCSSPYASSHADTQAILPLRLHKNRTETAPWGGRAFEYLTVRVNP